MDHVFFSHLLGLLLFFLALLFFSLLPVFSLSLSFFFFLAEEEEVLGVGVAAREGEADLDELPWSSLPGGAPPPMNPPYRLR